MYPAFFQIGVKPYHKYQSFVAKDDVINMYHFDPTTVIGWHNVSEINFGPDFEASKRSVEFTLGLPRGALSVGKRKDSSLYWYNPRLFR